VTKKRREKERNNFLETHEKCIQKCWEKIVGKKCEKTFFIFTSISLPKNGGKKRSKQFFQKIMNSAIKKCWKKIFGKNCKKIVFHINTKIVTKKGGGKTREIILPATPE